MGGNGMKGQSAVNVENQLITDKYALYNGDSCEIMKENINALDEIHKGACMGMDAISFVLDKVEDDYKKRFSKQKVFNLKIRSELEKSKRDNNDLRSMIESIKQSIDELKNKISH